VVAVLPPAASLPVTNVLMLLLVSEHYDMIEYENIACKKIVVCAAEMERIELGER
jgi:hypothetical protein